MSVTIRPATAEDIGAIAALLVELNAFYGDATTESGHEQSQQMRRGCSRVEWTTDDDNPDAIKFYEALGVRPRASKIFYRAEL